ncbi:NADP-dependent malic enzyme [Anthonomus grandis grandis]|uniref:NADP-dependent malic enzyme n=1 Tax=Anthonomus grandis grandis TaxID=2921223 RepID=UPI0021668DD8|nr:NADP-dependent malic enzyme [Anthonomus grandis grandis]
MFAQIPRSALAGLTRSSRLTVNSQKPLIVESLNFLNEEPKRCYHEVVGDIVTPGQVRGIDHLRDPRLNKGLAFTLEERQALGIHGLQPARFKTQEEQLELCRISIERYQEDLNKYLYLTELHDRNEKLFFRLLTENIEGLMPIVYTPTVGLACQKFGLIYRRPRGLFITINDIGHVFDVLKNWPEPNVKAIVVTDGERILGLGDLGACGMGIPVGKLALYTALAGIKPHECLPIVLDVGTNNQTLLEDPLYVGLRQKRVTGKLYDDFLDEFMEAVVKRYGQDTLIQFEDFGNHNAFRLLKKYRDYYCTFNDDIQGTASVAVSGLMASHRITGRKFSDNTICFLGAGGASLGIADLVVRAMVLEGASIEDARSKIWMFDIDGLLANERPEGNLEGHKKYYAKDHAPSKDFAALVNEIKPSILIGASATGGAFTPEILTAMGKFNEKPVIFALSNPTNKAECTAEQAYTCTEGRCVFASGSPFPPVTINGKTFKPGQGNNAYIFPGVALGILLSGIHHISEDVFLIASHTVAENVTEDDLGKGRIYPPLRDIHEVSIQIAIKILEYAYKERLATVYPKPKDLRRYVEEQQYNFNYEPSLPNLWPWPKAPYIKTKSLSATSIKS